MIHNLLVNLNNMSENNTVKSKKLKYNTKKNINNLQTVAKISNIVGFRDLSEPGIIVGIELLDVPALEFKSISSDQKPPPCICL